MGMILWAIKHQTIIALVAFGRMIQERKLCARLLDACGGTDGR